MRHRLLQLISVCIGLGLITWFVFGPTRAYPFINYDDPGYVAENPNVLGGLTKAGVTWSFSHAHGGNWHPLTSLSHMLDIQLFGLNAGKHHLVNVVLHTIAAILLFLFLTQATSSSWPTSDKPGRLAEPSTLWRSAFVAAIFAIHPLRVESVAWISERKDLLSGVFFMLTLIAYTGYVRVKSAWRYLLVAAFFVLGLMSKTMLVGTPIVLLLLDYWPFGRIRKPLSREQTAIGWLRLVVEKLPLFIVSIASSIATLLAQKETLGSFGSLPLSWRIGNGLVASIIYIRQMFWPVDLAVLYPDPENSLPLWQLMAAGAILLTITGASIACRKRFPYVLVGWLWYLVLLIPALGLIQIGLQGHADRFTYLPQIGLYLIIAWGLPDLIPAKTYLRAGLAFAAILAIGALFWCARIQTAYWRDSEVLWNHTLAVTSNNDVAQTNLSEILLRRHKPAEAIPHAQEAVRIRPDNAQACNNLGAAFMRIGQVKSAVYYLERSLALQPESVNAASSLAWILATCPNASQRDGVRAVQLAEFANARGGGNNPFLLHSLGAAYAEQGRYDEAVNVAEKAIQLAVSRGNFGLVEELKLNLENYRKQLPIRDPVFGKEKPE